MSNECGRVLSVVSKAKIRDPFRLVNAADWPDRPNWHALAACRGADPVLFFRGDYESLPYANNRYIAARTYCDRCPVTAECAAAGRSEHYGLWGGKSPNERRSPHRPRATTT